MKNNKTPLKASLKIGLFIFVAFALYAYGFQVTKVELEAFRNEDRQTSRERVMRRLASPRIIEFEQEEFIESYPVIVPCVEFFGELPEQPTSGPFITVTPSCANPGDIVTVEGFNFPAKAHGPVSFVPSTDETSTLALVPSFVDADLNGHFEISYKLPARESEDYQLVRATLRQNVGLPFFSQSSKDTWVKIVETVFMAFMATTLGTALSIPISFLAARNLMKEVKSPLSSLSFNIFGWPIGILLGLQLAKGLAPLGDLIATQPLYSTIGLAICFVIVYILAGRIFNPAANGEDGNSNLQKVLTSIVLIFSILLGIYLFADISIYSGKYLVGILGEKFEFFGNFSFQVGDLIQESYRILIALIFGAIVSSQLGQLGQRLSETLSSEKVKIINIISASIAFATIAFILGKGYEWLYQVNDERLTLWLPVGIAVIIAVILALINDPKKPLGTGMAIYTITRTLLNATRSVEPLIMAIVAVIWVGIGPFAGVLALALHTVAALSKLYSEQVESISDGPLEAVTATGANRLQTIVYAVIPQIIPPYISFTMYRWDINVRMSTVIGLVGGGGIGTLLIQNINLLNYRDASVQMLAIAVVVASMDYISSTMRERFV